ncbi:MAG: hypothetical protein PHF33_07080 [Candidatus Delongbacteria bacterium]|jgi:hypothetical protein|nr:hypothetical protein [Candidatus Delongbacteria bacterium]MDD4205373.1 hypothetical protein [Candidatus Delongbacteria bacterium]
MKKTTLVIIAMISLILMMSCSKEQTCTITEKDGVKIYKNKNLPTVEKLDFNPVKKFTMNADTNNVNYLARFDTDVIGVDSEENIFIADYGSSPKVNKYDKNGNFISTFVRNGSGPGEMSRIIYLCLKNDTVYVADESQTVSVFDNSGEFLYSFRPEGWRFQLKPVGTNKFICALLKGRVDQGRVLITQELALTNNSFQTIKVLNTIEYFEDDRDVPATWMYASISKDKIYVGTSGDMYYKINVFDLNGDLVEEVHKNYASIIYSDEEYEKMTRYLDKTGQAHLNKKNAYKKRAVVGVYNDKYGNLIVHPAVDTSKGKTDGMVLDFFSKGDNEYMNSYLLKTDEPYYQCDFNTFLIFYGDMMFKFDSDKSIIDVYDY